MSKLRKWLTGAEVIKLLDINRLDLIELAQGGKLQAHDHLTGEHIEIENQLLRDDDFTGSAVKRIPGGYTFVRKAIISPKEIESCVFLITEVNALKEAQPKIKSQNEAKWKKVRKWVKAKWDNNPDITIIDMALSNEVTEILGRNYAENTIRKHIKDLCSDHRPGRRPNANKK